ncbi:4,5-dihydroxyphthalate dehydrogenase [Rhodoferax koreense]|uniref:4,5-dihydroxyphthalate dehydrogenase n=1 Tax=Rhodoferax koreensis TaxID=1842727 RepID=A0A1P8K2F2_9BURK|nr:Gfo/Idh/MocA family oxidoreductase [Rhodoferax koreense]APW40182.1 4,5-dihydroxyphthalate dehydrogenase [Rhodoferax koreense]
MAGARTLRIGVAGLGRAFTLMLPTFLADSRVRLVAACDPIASARARFESDFGMPAYTTVETLCADPAVDLVYVATPHQFHAAHVGVAAAFGKHAMVEKPMALSLDECTAMIDATRKAGVHLIVGHSHSFNTPVRRTRELIDSGAYGAVKMITALNFTDFLYRPRRPEELVTDAGGGVIHSQATHQIDVVRLLGGGLVQSVRAHTGAWDPQRPTEGAYSALLGFEGGAFASATYSGYGHFDSDEFMGYVGEMGQAKNPADHGAARKRLATAASAAEEAALKAARNYGGALYQAPSAPAVPLAHQHFGPLIVGCEKADLRPVADGIHVYADGERSFLPLPPPPVPRQEVIDELIATVVDGRPASHSGEWARATTAVCLAVLESARNGRECRPAHQVGHNPA